MRLTEQQISRLQKLYMQELGLEVSREYALEKGLKLINLVQSVQSIQAIHN